MKLFRFPVILVYYISEAITITKANHKTAIKDIIIPNKYTQKLFLLFFIA